MKTTKFLLLAALALTTGACSNDDSIIESPATEAAKAGGITITATLAAKDGTVTRALSDDGGFKALWAVDEKIAVAYFPEDDDEGKKTVATITEVSSDGEATIEFTVDEGTKDNTFCFLVYPASVVDKIKSDDEGVVTLLAEQDGTLSADRDVCVGHGTIQVTEPGLDVESQPEAMYSISKFTIKNAATSADLAVTKLTIAIDEQQYNITPKDATSELYVFLPDVSNSVVSFSATGSDGKTYASSKQKVTIESGKYYSGDLLLAEPVTSQLSEATTSDCGKVVCTAGHLHEAMMAVPSGCTAVGILGKVTETGHGLILALQDAASQNWDTINGWTSETSYANTTLKLLPDDDAARGSSLTSYTKLGETTVSNWAVAQKSDYQTIFTNLGLVISEGNGSNYHSSVNAYITIGVGGTAISRGWTATESDTDYAAVFFGGSIYFSMKSEYYKVRPVLGF